MGSSAAKPFVQLSGGGCLGLTMMVTGFLI